MRAISTENDYCTRPARYGADCLSTFEIVIGGFRRFRRVPRPIYRDAHKTYLYKEEGIVRKPHFSNENFCRAASLDSITAVVEVFWLSSENVGKFP